MDIQEIVEAALDLSQQNDCGLDAAIISASFAALTKSVNTLIEQMTEVKAPKTQPLEEKSPQKPPETIIKDEKSPPKTPEVTLDQLRKAVMAASKAGKKEGIKIILSSYNVTKLPELEPFTYPVVLEKVEAL